MCPNIDCIEFDFRYTPSDGVPLDGTRYEIDIHVDAFPARSPKEPCESSASPASPEWKVEFRRTGYLATKLEGWVARKLLGNVSKGERFGRFLVFNVQVLDAGVRFDARRFVDSFCNRWRSRHITHCSDNHAETRREEGGGAWWQSVHSVEGMCTCGGGASEGDRGSCIVGDGGVKDLRSAWGHAVRNERIASRLLARLASSAAAAFVAR